jgi:hypothetical protein
LFILTEIGGISRKTPQGKVKTMYGACNITVKKVLIKVASKFQSLMEWVIERFLCLMLAGSGTI